jgi:hypothetical protein
MICIHMRLVLMFFLYCNILNIKFRQIKYDYDGINFVHIPKVPEVIEHSWKFNQLHIYLFDW